MIFVTGGAGFIGSNFVQSWLAQCNEPLLIIDKLTYAGSLANLPAVQHDPRIVFVHADICDADQMNALLKAYKPTAIVHFAAESHVDRSIEGPAAFVQTNINGTFILLSAALDHWSSLGDKDKVAFRFLHVSTDEVYGSLDNDAPPFSETSAYAPNSPYSASKAASDHLVRSYHHTYGLPTLTVNCSNNYGPNQLPEKLIPLMIKNALAGKPLPIYGDGQQIRDWLYVCDHCDALHRVLVAGVPGQTYNIGGHNEKTNLAVVHLLCEILDNQRPSATGASYRRQIMHVADRPGHDRRYAINAGKIERELGWVPTETIESGMQKTVKWYLANQEWLKVSASAIV